MPEQVLPGRPKLLSAIAQSFELILGPHQHVLIYIALIDEVADEVDQTPIFACLSAEFLFEVSMEAKRFR
jgi:hypothetical protein